MTLNTYLLNLAAVAALVLSPGATMPMCRITALRHGPRKAMAAAAGCMTAVLGTVLLSALGLGALMATFETAFWVLKAAGAAYLIWLGTKTFHSQDCVFGKRPEGTRAAPHVAAHRLYLQGLMLAGSNPKAMLFVTAFSTQFLHPGHAFAPQFAVLVLCGLGVVRLAPALRKRQRMRWFNRISVRLFAFRGSRLLATRRAT